MTTYIVNCSLIYQRVSLLWKHDNGVRINITLTLFTYQLESLLLLRNIRQGYGKELFVRIIKAQKLDLLQNCFW